MRATKARKNSATAWATNTRTTGRNISWRRIISARIKYITSRRIRAWKRKSRSASRNGARNWRKPASRRPDKIYGRRVERPKSRATETSPRRVAKNRPRRPRRGDRANLRPAQSAGGLEKIGGHFIFRAVAGRSGCLAATRGNAGNGQDRRPAPL